MRIAIIGFGPKGLYGLERLVAEIKASKLLTWVDIDLFNRSPFLGCGDVYRPDQPDYFKMNIPGGRVTMWREDEPSPIVPNPVDFQEWCKNNQYNYHKDDFPPRALVGKYLKEGYELLIKHMPAHICVNAHINEVINVVTQDHGIEVITKQKGSQTTLVYDYLLLATGHPEKILDDTEKHYLKLTKDKTGKGYVPFIYPHKKLDIVQPGATVAIKGMGLTFVDTLLAFTEGRGGDFFTMKGKLQYRPSGNEPRCIYPFSRSGLPMVARTSHLVSEAIEPQLLTPHKVRQLKQKHYQVDFEKHLWPLILEEMKWAVYKRLFKAFGYSVEKLFGPDYEIHVKNFHKLHPNIAPWQPERWFNPLHHSIYNLMEEHEHIMTYIVSTNEAVRKGDASTAATQVWPAVLPSFDMAFEDAGLTPLSHKKFFEEYAPLLQRISYGPPLTNMEKLEAVARAGLLDFSMARSEEVKFDEHSGSFNLRSKITHKALEVDYLVDARIPKTSLPTTKGGLYHAMMANGEIRKWHRKEENTSMKYTPGCLELNAQGQVIAADGKVNKRIYVTGMPTEGITFDNESISPHRNDKFVKRWVAAITKTISQEETSQKYQTREFTHAR